MIDKGSPNEVFTILKWHLEIRISELIDYIATLPSSATLVPAKLSVSEILMFNTSHEIKSEVVNRMNESRKVQPLLLACIQREFWVIDGNHRLKKNVQDGNSVCEVILIPNKLLLKYCQPFMKRSTSRGLQKQMKDIKDILGICS